MTDIIVFPPSAKERAEGIVTRHMRVAGPDAPPPPASVVTGPHNGGYFFRQDHPSTVWRIPHGLNRFPTLTVQDTAGVYQLALASWDSANEVVLTFSEPTQGFIYLD